METKHKTLAECKKAIIEKYEVWFPDWTGFISDKPIYDREMYYDEAAELYASEENRKKYEPKQSDVEQDARIFCEHLDEELGEAWSNDYDELPKRMAEFALKWQSQQPVSIQWLSDEEISNAADTPLINPSGEAAGFEYACIWLQSELRKRVNSVDPVEFLRWITEETHFKPTDNVNEFKALHMSDGWVYRTSEQLLEDYIEHLTSKTKQHE